MPKPLKTLLSIAGSDPMGGAGIQADIRAGILLGIHVATAITTVTAQNSKKVYELNALPSKVLESQLSAITEDILPDAIKIGMIGSFQNAKTIIKFLQSLPSEIPIVIDPILRTSVSHKELLSGNEFYKIFTNELIPLATIITPNIEEAQFFKEAKAIVIKGGHSKNNLIKDTLIIGEKILTSEHPRVECCNLHGTGCVYSSLLASYLAKGFSIEDSFVQTSKKMFEIINKSSQYTLGESTYGPLNINNYYL